MYKSKPYKILVIPDIHGSDVWKWSINKVFYYDFIIFLGDYMDSFNLEKSLNAPNNLREIIEFKKNHEDKIVLLTGNHDYQYINPKVRCSGYKEEISASAKAIFTDNIDYFKVFYKIGNLLFSHSGFTKDYFNNAEYVSDILTDMDTISVNRYPDHIWTVGKSRGGSAKRGSCLWADWDEFKNDYMINDVLNYHQIFGHTAGKSMRTLTNGRVSLYCLDTLAHNLNTLYEVVYDDNFNFISIDYINTLI
jgi:predicted phosphodiesterase